MDIVCSKRNTCPQGGERVRTGKKLHRFLHEKHFEVRDVKMGQQGERKEGKKEEVRLEVCKCGYEKKVPCQKFLSFFFFFFFQDQL